MCFMETDELTTLSGPVLSPCQWAAGVIENWGHEQWGPELSRTVHPPTLSGSVVLSVFSLIACLL